MAGFSELDIFGEANTVDSLAGGDILKWNQIEELPYYQVFTKLYLDKVRNKVEKKYSEIMRHKYESELKYKRK